MNLEWQIYLLMVGQTEMEAPMHTHTLWSFVHLERLVLINEISEIYMFLIFVLIECFLLPLRVRDTFCI